LNSLRERGGGTNPKILYQYENGLINEYHKALGWTVVTRYMMNLDVVIVCRISRTSKNSLVLLRKMTGRPIDYSYDMDSNDFAQGGDS
jgi:hypothetical protein